MAKTEEHTGVVYKIVTDNSKGKFAILVSVFSPNPDETIQRYARHCAVDVCEQPRRVEGMDPTAHGIDTRIEHIDKEPGFAVRNRLTLNWWDRVLLKDHKA